MNVEAPPPNVVWTSPSVNEQGSMPLGNGDIGLNAWIEPGGDLVFYVAKSDCWDEQGRLLKLGRIRVRCGATASDLATDFQQVLDLHRGEMTVAYGPREARWSLRVWVDAQHPDIHIEIASPRPVAATALLEPWRVRPEILTSLECSDVLKESPYTPNHPPPPIPTVVEPDTLLADAPEGIGWYHHNARSVGPALHAETQGIADFPRPDPLLHRTFGALVTAEGGVRVDERTLRAPAATRHRFSVHVLTRHPATPEQWLTTLRANRAAAEALPLESRREAHRRWWQSFWARSWIRVRGEGPAQEDASVVDQAYALQRYMNACAGRGRHPIKFNGSLFTVAHEGKPGGPDYRRWGPGYWWQNTRLPYTSMCASGDYDLLQPLFTMYGRELMPLFAFRTGRHLGHDGAYVPECIYFWGDVFNETYGWTPYAEREDKLQASGYHKWEWVAGPELVFMMLDYYEHTLDEPFLREVLLPTARVVLTFFDRHYATGPDGKLFLHPAQALETWWDCDNPLPEIAGLHAVTARLPRLAAHAATAADLAAWQALRAKLPPLPTREVDGETVLAPAGRFANKRNMETPELYAVYPFRLVAVGRPDVELGLRTLDRRQHKGHTGWQQDELFMAYLGRAEQARDGLVARARAKHEASRFPAFWGPNYDWVPDQDHGSILLTALQSMLLQTDGKTIRLLPAWPTDWEADFRLHAPLRTVIEGSVKNGRLVRLEVTPESRRNDVVLPPP